MSSSDLTVPKPSAVTRRSAGPGLMPPPPKRIKRPKNVIDEESYTDAISAIIARDFFPGLLETETQQEYLDALDSQDARWISSASRRLHQVMTPHCGRRGQRGTSIQTPNSVTDTLRGLTGDTPSMDTPRATCESSLATPEIDTNMSLDRFQALYTSEDNESFYKLLDKQNQKRAGKYAWMWSENNKMPSKMMLKQKEVNARLLSSRGSLRDNGGAKDRLALRNPDEKPARPDSWRSKPDNGLMFAPESIEDSIKTIVQAAQEDSRAGPRGLTHANTRMPDPNLTGDYSVPQSPSLSAVRDAIDGHHRCELSESGTGGNETPRVNGYAFVDDEPTNELPLPLPIFQFGDREHKKNPFVIKEQSKREDLHHRMVDKNARTKRASFKAGLTGRIEITPIPKFPSSPRPGLGQLTPAGQRLWSKVGDQNGASPNAFGAKNQASRTGSGLRNHQISARNPP